MFYTRSTTTAIRRQHRRGQQRRGETRACPAAKHAAPGLWRASVAHLAACWSQDTIPKPDGLAGPLCGPSSNQNRTHLARCSALFEPGSAVGFAAMEDAPDFEGVGDVDEEKPVVGDAEPEFVAPLKRLHVALAGAGEAVERGENAHGSLAVDAAHIGLGLLGPDDPLHCGSR